MTPAPPRRLTAVLVILACAAAGCRTEGLAFRQDRRVHIVSPADNSTLTLPFTIRWAVTGFEISGPDGAGRDDAGYFVVLLDVSPMPPGESLRYFARDDRGCLRTDACPDTAYLEDRGVHPTSDTELVVEALRDTRPPDRPSAPDVHEIAIVLVNGRGERIGEGAFSVGFTVDRSRT